MPPDPIRNEELPFFSVPGHSPDAAPLLVVRKNRWLYRLFAPTFVSPVVLKPVRRRPRRQKPFRVILRGVALDRSDKQLRILDRSRDITEPSRLKPLALVIPWAVFLWAVLRYDIFQLYFDGGFLSRTIGKRLEMPLLKLLGKKIIVSAYGGDVRVERITRTLGEYNCCMDCTQRLKACICDDNLARRNLAHVQRYADSTLSMGDMTEYTPGSRNDLFYWAIDLKKWPFVGVSLSSSPVKVLHAPNHPQFKGTRYLEACIKQLQDEGYPVQLVLVTELSNEEAKEVYKQADIVADQFLIGWHGNFAVEAMALGKPVVAYIRKPEVYLPHGVECPIVNANPGTLRHALVTLIENPTLRYELGVKGRQYVEQVFSLERVGARMDRLYRQLEGDSAPVGGGVR